MNKITFKITLKFLIRFFLWSIVIALMLLILARLAYEVPYLRDRGREVRDKYRIKMVERTFESNDVKQQNVQNIIDAGSEINNSFPYPNQVAFLYSFNKRLKIYVEKSTYCYSSQASFITIDQSNESKPNFPYLDTSKKKEVAVSCVSGGQMGSLYLYSINQEDGSVIFLGSFYSYGIPDLVDMNGDGFLDVVESDREYPEDPSEVGYKWVNNSYYWNNGPEVKGFEKNPVKSYAN